MHADYACISAYISQCQYAASIGLFATRAPTSRKTPARKPIDERTDALVCGILGCKRILEERRYVSQFVTRTSNGGLTAFVGGHRYEWEHRIFSGAYDASAPQDRPVYGALSLDAGLKMGSTGRFGAVSTNHCCDRAAD
ncbi:MAG TPA: DUF3626 domain-containing protein [Microbacterium sp.]|nr:DUF3626 domain-containing protein [Microbacterium sp.]